MVDFSLLSARMRNSIIRMLETGFDNGGDGADIVFRVFKVEFPISHAYDTVYISNNWAAFVPEEQLDALESVEALSCARRFARRVGYNSSRYKVPKNHARNILSLKGVPKWDATVSTALAIVRSGAKVDVCNGHYFVVSRK